MEGVAGENGAMLSVAEVVKFFMVSKYDADGHAMVEVILQCRLD